MRSDDRQPDDNPDDSLPREPELGTPRWQWPCCPQCSRRRQARCPTCDLGSDDFPLADYLPGLETEAVENPPSGLLLMCPTCDEAFAPQFYRYCQQCGHDFGGGVVPDATEADALTGRAAVVLFALVLLALAMLVYFWWLFAA